MSDVLLWLISQFSYLVTQVLNWKILGDFSLLHFILGGLIISIILKFVTFSISKEDK